MLILPTRLTARHLLKDLSRLLAAGAAGLLVLALPGCVQVRHVEYLDAPPAGTLRLAPERAGAPRPAAGPSRAFRPVVVPKLGEEAPPALAPAPRVPAVAQPPDEDDPDCTDGTCKTPLK